MKAHEEWIQAGFAALRRGGIDAVRVDSLATALGKTKGSFHHHFAGAAAFQQELLDRFTEDAQREISELAHATAELPVTEALRYVGLHAQFDPALEAAIRSWSGVSEAAQAALKSIDAARLEILTDIWNRDIPDRERARTAALVPHLVVVGASATQPVPNKENMAQVLELLVALVPYVHAVSTATPDSQH